MHSDNCINIYTNNLEEQTQESNLNQGIRSILLDVHSSVSAMKAFGLDRPDDHFTIKYTSKRIILGETQFPCEIFADASTSNGVLRVTGSKTIEYTGLDMTGVQFDDGSGPQSILTFDCGETITISGV